MAREDLPLFIRRDENDDEWRVDDSQPFGEASYEYLGVHLGFGVGMSFNGMPRGRICVSGESIGWILAGNLADAYRPEGLQL